MPKASVLRANDRFDLESLEGGWIELRRLSYGQKLERADLAYKVTIGADVAAGKNPQQSAQGIVEGSSRAVSLYEFRKCVVDHNLFEDDAETQKLNFASPDILDKLDPRVGEEIGTLIDSLNNFDPEGN